MKKNFLFQELVGGGGATDAPLPHLFLQPWDDISWKVFLDQLWQPNFFCQLLAPPTPNHPLPLAYFSFLLVWICSKFTGEHYAELWFQ